MVEENGTERVVSAQIDHICLTDAAAYGGWTGSCNVGRSLDTGNSRLVRMAEEWDAAFAAHRTNRRGENYPAYSIKRTVAPEAMEAERKLSSALRMYKGGNPHLGRGSSPPAKRSASKGGNLKVVSELFAAIFASRNARAARLDPIRINGFEILITKRATFSWFCQKGNVTMSIGTILLIILVIALLGGFSGIGGGPFYGTGYYGGGGLGLVLIVVLVLVLLGRL